MHTKNILQRFVMMKNFLWVNYWNLFIKVKVIMYVQEIYVDTVT